MKARVLKKMLRLAKADNSDCTTRHVLMGDGGMLYSTNGYAMVRVEQRNMETLTVFGAEMVRTSIIPDECITTAKSDEQVMELAAYEDNGPRIQVLDNALDYRPEEQIERFSVNPKWLAMVMEVYSAAGMFPTIEDMGDRLRFSAANPGQLSESGVDRIDAVLMKLRMQKG